MNLVNKQASLTLLMVLMFMPLFALTQDEPFTPATILTSLAPFVVWGATQLFRWAVGVIPAWATVLVVTGLSTAVAAVSTTLENPDLGFLQQIGFGLLAIVLNEGLKAFGVKKKK